MFSSRWRCLKFTESRAVVIGCICKSENELSLWKQIMRWRMVCNSWRHRTKNLVPSHSCQFQIPSSTYLLHINSRWFETKRRVPCCTWQVEGVELSQRVQVPTSDSCAWDGKEKDRIKKGVKKVALEGTWRKYNIYIYILSLSFYPLSPTTCITLKMHVFFRTNSCHSPCDEETQLWELLIHFDTLRHANPTPANSSCSTVLRPTMFRPGITPLI